MSGGNFGPSKGETYIVLAFGIVLMIGVPAGLGFVFGHAQGREFEHQKFSVQVPWGTTCLRHEPRKFVDHGWFGTGEIYTREVCVHAEYKR